MGSPIVFHTAPPQPASNARITCSPQFVGGAEASQNGFGEEIPANFTETSGFAFRSAMRALQQFSHSERRSFAVGYGIDDFASPIHAVAAGKVLRVRGLARCAVHGNAAVFRSNAAARFQEFEQRQL